MTILKDGYEVDSFTSEYGGSKVVIGIDSSKTDTAIAVGDEYGHILHDYEIRGGGKDIDVYDLCAFTRIQIKTLFAGADIQVIGIEDIITKKEKGYKGIDIHQSRYKITAVFDNFMFLFEEFFGIRPRRVNNWDWKVGILPEEFRSRDHKKGSKDYFNSINNRWAGRNDNVTDAVCILMYLYKTIKFKPVYYINDVKPSNVEFTKLIVPAGYKVPTQVKEFIVKNQDTLEHNVIAIADVLGKNEIGFLRVACEDIPMEWIYSTYLTNTNELCFQKEDTNAIILIGRK